MGRTSEWSLEGEFPKDERTLRVAYRYGFGGVFDFSVEGVRRESAVHDAPEHGVWLRSGLRW